MHMHKSVHWIFWIVGIIVVFFAGFYVGTLDAHERDVIITSQCAGITMEQSVSANFESIDGQIIRNEKQESEIYTTGCMCFASDAMRQNVWVDTIEIAGNSEDTVRTECANNCQALCQERLAGFTFME